VLLFYILSGVRSFYYTCFILLVGGARTGTIRLIPHDDPGGGGAGLPSMAAYRLSQAADIASWNYLGYPAWRPAGNSLSGPKRRPQSSDRVTPWALARALCASFALPGPKIGLSVIDRCPCASG